MTIQVSFSVIEPGKTFKELVEVVLKRGRAQVYIGKPSESTVTMFQHYATITSLPLLRRYLPSRSDSVGVTEASRCDSVRHTPVTDVSQVLGSPAKLQVIHGPPGTGKTRTAVKITVNSTRPVLFLARRNRSVDDFIKRANLAGVPSQEIVRLGFSRIISEKYSLRNKKPSGRNWKNIKKLESKLHHLFDKSRKLENILDPLTDEVIEGTVLPLTHLNRSYQTVIERAYLQFQPNLEFEDFINLEFSETTQSSSSQFEHQPYIEINDDYRDGKDQEELSYLENMYFSKLANIKAFTDGSDHEDQDPVFEYRVVPAGFTPSDNDEGVYDKESRDMTEAERRGVVFTKLYRKVDRLIETLQHVQIAGKVK